MATTVFVKRETVFSLAMGACAMHGQALGEAVWAGDRAYPAGPDDVTRF
ncbi:MAG: hypothetical protein ACFCBV_09285 [Phycisphaerales bacterium]|nr:hypothetical protein [Phycisphaerales bacterium]